MEDSQRSINAEACLQRHDLQLTVVHLKIAKWNVEQAKKARAVLGRAKNQKADGKLKKGVHL